MEISSRSYTFFLLFWWMIASRFILSSAFTIKSSAIHQNTLSTHSPSDQAFERRTTPRQYLYKNLHHHKIRYLTKRNLNVYNVYIQTHIPSTSLFMSENDTTSTTNSAQKIAASTKASLDASSNPSIDAEIETNKDKKPNNNNSGKTPSSSSKSKYSSAPDSWEELHGNYILRPPSSQEQPRALIHFLGGALIGAAPDLAYRYLLERLAAQGYLIVATPYNLSFDYLTTCDTILDKFERIAPMLARQYGAVPVVGVGHSCGALLHLLITTLFPDTPRAANALLSYNNKNVKDAVPLFDQVVAPIFTQIAANETQTASGVEIIQLVNQIVRTTLDGEVPSDQILQELTEGLLPPPLQTKPSINNTNPLTSFITIPKPLRDTIQSSLLEPLTTALSATDLLPPFRQSIDVLDQIPLLIQEVADGTTEFTPPRTSIQSATKRAYRARRTLLIQYENDPIDESPEIESILKEAETIMRMKRPMIQMDLQRIVLDGNHATPVLAPPGIEVADRVENFLGGDKNSKSKEEGAGDGGDTKEDSVTTSLYKQVDETVDILATWLEEGEL